MTTDEWATCPFCNETKQGVMKREINGAGDKRTCCADCAAEFRSLRKPKVLRE